MSIESTKTTQTLEVLEVRGTTNGDSYEAIIERRQDSPFPQLHEVIKFEPCDIGNPESGPKMGWSPVWVEFVHCSEIQDAVELLWQSPNSEEIFYRLIALVDPKS